MPAPAQDNSIMSTHGASRLARQTTAQAPRQAAARHPCSLALRILIVATIGYILATQFVSRSFSYLLEPITADLVYERRCAARCTPCAPNWIRNRRPNARPTCATTSSPTGLGLQIKTPAQAALTRAERDMVTSTASSCGTTTTPSFAHARRAGAVAGSDLALTALARENGDLDGLTVLVLIPAGVLLLFWAMPIHRDLDVVRNATLRMAQGDLDVRRLSRISGIRHIGESFNHMAAHRRAGRQPAQPDQRRLARCARWRGSRSRSTC